MKQFYTIFGHTGFFGKNLSTYLKLLNKEIFLPKKGIYKFSKNLGDIIYCIGIDEVFDNPPKSIDANLKIISQIIFNNKFNSFTFLSSTRLYKNSTQTLESSFIKINPNKKNDYFNSLKLAAENLCLSYGKNIKVVRLSNIFGSYFTKQKYLLPTLLRSSVKQKKVDILINKNSKKNYIHAIDAIKIILKIIKKSKFRIYNIAGEKRIKIETIAQEIKTINKCKINYFNQKIKYNEPKINISRIKNEFNFKSTYSLKNCIKDMLDEVK